MKKTIESLYGCDMGNCFEWYTESGEYRKAKERLQKLSAEFSDGLRPEQEEGLGRLLEQALSLLSIEAEKAFTDGFCLASRLWAETFCGQGDDESAGNTQTGERPVQPV